jgi:pimeloyl-ACP methyl ester carboxylesterase
MRALALLCVAASLGCVTPGPHADAPPAEGIATDGTSYALVNGAWLRVRVQGTKSSATPIVFLHGYGSRLEAWKLVQPELSTDRLTISLDQRGFGLSERPGDAYGPEVHAADVVALMDLLGVERAIVVGHSYGAGVALRAALRHPDRVAGVGIVSGFAFDEQVPTSFRWAKVPVVGELLFGAFYQEVPGEKYLYAFHDRGRFVSARALEEMKALMARPGSTFAALETVRGMDYPAVQGRYRELRVPTTLVFGEDDRVTPTLVAKKFAATFDGARFVQVPACGHMPMWERPQATTNALRDLVRDVEEAAQSAAPMPVRVPVPVPEAAPAANEAPP